MATPTQYTYSISTAFPNHRVNSDDLYREIAASAILTAQQHIDTHDDDCDIWFKDVLSNEDESVLDVVVNAHQGTPTPAEVQPVSIDGVPTMNDGSLFVAPCMFFDGLYLYITGAGDGTNRGDGQQFMASSEAGGDTTVEWGFNDIVFMAGGTAQFMGGEFGDWASLEIYAPATVITPNGSHTGNCNVAGGVIAPAAGNGDYDVDLLNAVPVPAQQMDKSYNGFWDLSDAVVGKGTITVGTPGQAHWHLVPAAITLIRYGNRLPIMGDHTVPFNVPAVEPKACLPQWKGKLTLHNSGHTGLKLCWNLMMGRVKTV